MVMVLHNDQQLLMSHYLRMRPNVNIIETVCVMLLGNQCFMCMFYTVCLCLCICACHEQSSTDWANTALFACIKHVIKLEVI